MGRARVHRALRRQARDVRDHHGEREEGAEDDDLVLDTFYYDTFSGTFYFDTFYFVSSNELAGADDLHAFC